MGLLTKIFGNPESGANGSGEPSVADEQASDTAAPPSGSKAQATSRTQASSRGAGSASEAASGSKGAGTSGPGGSGGAASGSGSGSGAGSNGAATGEKNAHSPFAKGEGGRSGIRPTVDPTRPREAARPTTASRRPEHPRMYLRPTPATLDPAVPGTTRRQPISVRPGAKEVSLSRGSAPPSSSSSRGSAPPPKRRRPELGGGDPPSWRELPPEPPSTRPPSSHPRPAMVVSPVSLTAEELQPGARPKMPTLVGLGTAIGVPALPDYEGTEADYEDTEADYEDASDSLLDDAPALGSLEARSPEARSAEAESSTEESSTDGSAARGDAAPSEPSAAPFELSAPVSRPGEGARAAEAAGGSPAAEASASSEVQDAVTPERIVASAQLLADFALKLSLGPVSRAWVPEVRRSADTLLLAGEQRRRTTLSAVAARLLELLPSADAAATAPAEAAPVEAAPVEAAPVEAAPVEAASESPDTASATIVAEPIVAEPAAAIAAQPAALGPLGGALREQVLHEVSRLTGLLPEWPAAAQDLAEETRRRETRIVRELLASVDGLRRDQRARIEAQLGLEALGSMVPEALAEELEAPPERAAELGLVIEIYRLQRQEHAPDVGNVAAVAQALSELERRQSEFENCDPERKDVQQVLRGRRREAAMQLNLSLAERGELEWLELLEPMSVPERIERLHHWLDASNEKPQSERPSSERLSRA